MPKCLTCKWFARLSPGSAAICFEHWRHLEWNDAVPLTTAEDTCDKHEIPGPGYGPLGGAVDSHGTSIPDRPAAPFGPIGITPRLKEGHSAFATKAQLLILNQSIAPMRRQNSGEIDDGLIPNR